jgi:hypothetical protein
MKHRAHAFPNALMRRGVAAKLRQSVVTRTQAILKAAALPVHVPAGLGKVRFPLLFPPLRLVPPQRSAVPGTYLRASPHGRECRMRR